MDHPATAGLVKAIKAQKRVFVKAGGSKTALHFGEGDAPLEIDVPAGIIEYDPGEYTFTAYAGTPLQEVEKTLAVHGQYLPFDPLFVDDGATLGGTLVANLSGSGRYRYGGVRDFLLGIKFIDGRGRLVQGGGKVVKNASGFDLPKFFVGSLGRYGIVVETTWKVFPVDSDYANVTAAYRSLSDLEEASFALAGTPLEINAQDWTWENGRWLLDLRLGGRPDSLPGRGERLATFLKEHSQPVELSMNTGPDEKSKWRALNSARWQPAGTTLVKIPISPKRVAELETILSGQARRYAAAGNVAWTAAPDVDHLDSQLQARGFVGLAVRGQPRVEPIIGRRHGLAMARRVKRALDPNQVFGEGC